MQKLSVQTEIESHLLLQSITEIIVMVFGGRILSIYLGGSFNRDQLTVTSDMDITVVFRGAVCDEEYGQFMALRESLQRLSPLRLDLWPISENKIKFRPANASVRSSRCLYGEAFLHLVPAQTIEAFAMQSIHKAIHYMAVLRGRPEFNPAPLTYPDVKDQYSGYTRCGDIDDAESFKPGTRVIVSMLTQCTTAILAVEHGIEVGTKQESIEQYVSRVADKWKDFVPDLYHMIKTQLQYELPHDHKSQTRLSSLVQHLPAFENDALVRFKPAIRDSLQCADDRRRKLALVVLKNVQINDEAIIHAVQSLSEFEDDGLLTSVKALYANGD